MEDEILTVSVTEALKAKEEVERVLERGVQIGRTKREIEGDGKGGGGGGFEDEEDEEEVQVRKGTI